MFYQIKLLNLLFSLLLTVFLLKPMELRGETLQDVLNGVIIVGAHGRDGGGGGIEDTISKLKSKLKSTSTKIGIPEGNIYEVSWNSKYDSLAGYTPDTEKQLSLIKAKLGEYNIDKPTYLVLFGHSFGGWLTARLSRRIKENLNYIPDVVFLLDAVLPTEYIFLNKEKRVESKYGVNYYQNLAITYNPCMPLSAVTTCLGQFSCGVKHFEGLSVGNIDSNFKRDRDGKISKKQCIDPRVAKVGDMISDVLGTGETSLKVNILQSHTSIDDDKYLQKKLIDYIVKDINNIKNLYPKKDKNHPDNSSKQNPSQNPNTNDGQRYAQYLKWTDYLQSVLINYDNYNSYIYELKIKSYNEQNKWLNDTYHILTKWYQDNTTKENLDMDSVNKKYYENLEIYNKMYDSVIGKIDENYIKSIRNNKSVLKESISKYNAAVSKLGYSNAIYNLNN